MMSYETKYPAIDTEHWLIHSWELQKETENSWQFIQAQALNLSSFTPVRLIIPCIKLLKPRCRSPEPWRPTPLDNRPKHSQGSGKSWCFCKHVLALGTYTPAWTCISVEVGHKHMTSQW